MEEVTKTLNFTRNYNHKFSNSYFVTIRSLETIQEKNLLVGDWLAVQQNYKTLFMAKVLSIEEIDLDHLSESQKTLLMLDGGCHWLQASDAYRHFFKSNKVAVITLYI